MTDEEPIAKVIGIYDGYFMAASINEAALPVVGAQLYGAPPKPVWRELTTAETKALWAAAEKKPSAFAEMIGRKLKERNS
jgi:hypothetical protein